MGIKKRSVGLIALFALEACASAPTEVGQRDFGRYDSAVEAAIASWNSSEAGAADPVRGATVAVVHKRDGLVHLQSFGDFTDDRLYLVASASKILSAGVIMRLQDQGALDIAQPIDRYLGAWGEHKANVTLAQLMSGSSGLPSADEVFAAAEMPNVPQRYAAHVCEVKTQPSLTACGKAIYQDDVPENNQKPDTEFRYGGSAWQLAGAIAEVVSGKSWAELVDETYAKPCELDSLGYTNQGEITRKRYTYPPDVDGDVSKLPITDNPLIEGGAYSTASDYAQVLLMHLRGGKCGSARVLSEKSVETMQADRVAAYGGKVTTDPTNPFTGYGLGWWTTDSFIADPGAYGAFPLIDLNNDFAVVLLLEAKSSTGPAIMRQVQPILVEIMAEQKS